MDDQKRARELLAKEYERDGITHVPDCIRREAMLTEMEHRAVRAITAALHAAPEGFVMVPVEPTREMIVACENQWSVGSATDMALREWTAMLAASPHGVK